MKGLLQRLASQVVPGGPPRVRAAVSMRRAPPLTAPPDGPTRGQPREDAFGPTTFERGPFDPHSGQVVPEATFTNASSLLGEEAARATTPELEFSSHQRERTRVELREVPRLLPEVAPEVDSRARALSAASDGRNWGVHPVLLTEGRLETGPSEVHVHIGRIEVTAVQESPAKRPKREPARPRKTLEEYLTGRTKGDP